MDPSHRPPHAKRRLLPAAREVSDAYVLGSLLIAVTNAVAIAVAVPLPPGGPPLRLLHHVFDFLQTVGFGALFAAVAWFVGWGIRQIPYAAGSGAPWLGAAAYVALSTLGSYALLDATFDRGAIQFADKLGLRVPGVADRALFVGYFALVGAGLPLLHAFAHHVGKSRAGPVLFGAALAGTLINRIAVTDAYEDVHAIILLASACLGGAVLRAGAGDSPVIGGLASAFGSRTGVAILVGCAAFGILVPPPNRVRLELFKEPGAVAAFVLSQAVWDVPLAPGSSDWEGVARPAPERAGTLRTHASNVVGAPVVVLVTIDALRGDVIEEHASEKRLPNLARLRDEGAHFRRAVAPSSQTSTTLATLFSGRYFSQLKWELYGRGRDRRMYPARDPSRRFTEDLTKAGVRTVNFLSPGFLAAEYGIVRGFSEEHIVEYGHARASAVLTPLLRALREHGPEPAFFYTHLMEPHEPYDRGKLRRGSAKDRYLSEIEVVDDWIGELVQVMKQGFPLRGYIVLAADHGEAFGEHGTFFHSKTLYDELLHVPLIFWGSTFRGRRHDERVGLIDIGPTLLELFHVPSTAESMGQSLLPVIRGLPYQRTTPLVAEGRLKRALYTDDDLKVIENHRNKTAEVYDLRADPGELSNLFESKPALARRAQLECRAFFAEHALEGPGYRPPYKR